MCNITPQSALLILPSIASAIVRLTKISFINNKFVIIYYLWAWGNPRKPARSISLNLQKYFRNPQVVRTKYSVFPISKKANRRENLLARIIRN